MAFGREGKSESDGGERREKMEVKRERNKREDLSAVSALQFITEEFLFLLFSRESPKI